MEDAVNAVDARGNLGRNVKLMLMGGQKGRNRTGSYPSYSESEEVEESDPRVEPGLGVAVLSGDFACHVSYIENVWHAVGSSWRSCLDVDGVWLVIAVFTLQACCSAFFDLVARSVAILVGYCYFSYNGEWTFV